MFGKSKIRKSLALWKAHEAYIPSKTRTSWISYNCRRLHITHIHAKVDSTIVIADDANDMVLNAYQRIRAHELREIREKRAAGQRIDRRDRIALMAARWYLKWALERVQEAKEKVVDTK